MPRKKRKNPKCRRHLGFILAEREGFEPSIREDPYTGFRALCACAARRVGQKSEVAMRDMGEGPLSTASMPAQRPSEFRCAVHLRGRVRSRRLLWTVGLQGVVPWFEGPQDRVSGHSTRSRCGQRKSWVLTPARYQSKRTLTQHLVTHCASQAVVGPRSRALI